MEKCQEESLRHTPDQQQHQQQQTTVEEQRCPFLSPTTPVWGDRNVSEQSVEETNDNLGFSFVHLVPNTSDSRISMSSLSRNNSSSSIRSLTENTTNNQSSIDATQLPRQCRLCTYVATERTEYIEHVIAHCTFTKSTYVEIDHVNEYIDDEEHDDSGNEGQPQSKGKKRPKISKPKLCNKCDFIAKTKLILWLHMRQHFVQEECSGYVCVLCPFATTLKHHMTFHWFSAHDDFKGFMCTECTYSCVSKSMLTSHMKTHSEVYQYNCGSCSYRTKFCNAMKKHLKDSLHLPGPVLNPDGTPNPFATIDIYGNKRGPRRRPFVEEKNEQTETTEDRPTTSGIIPLVSAVPTLSTSVSSSPISSTTISDSPDSKEIWMSPIRSSPTKISPVRTLSTPLLSHSNSLLTDVLTKFDRVNNEDEVNPSINRNTNSNTNEQILKVLPNPMFSTLCYLLINDIETRRNLDDEERGGVFRLLQNAQKFFPDPGSIEHIASATDANVDLSDNAKTLDEPSISTIINKPSISTIINKPSTSTAIDEPSTSTLVSEPQPEAEENGVPDEPLDLSMSAMSKIDNQPQFQESVASSSSRRSKRKRKATKLEYLMINENMNDNEIQTENTNQILYNPNTKPSLPALLTANQFDLQRRSETLNVTHNANIYNSSFICYYCHIIFANEIMYAVHMSFHSAKNPLMCALCDRKSANVVAFFLHLIRTKH